MIQSLGYSYQLKKFCYRVSFWDDSGGKHDNDFSVVSEFPIGEGLSPDAILKFCTPAPDSCRLPELKGVVVEFGLSDLDSSNLLVSGNVSVDERLVTFAKAGLFMHIRPPAEWARFAPTQIVFTNPKCGKTILYQRTGICKGDVSEKALLGYGTAEKARLGLLSRTCGQMVAIDEAPEAIGDSLFGKLLPALETGQVSISKGMLDHTYSSCSPFAFLGNPQAGALDSGLMREFDNMMLKISRNASAYGSRVAGVLFGLDFARVYGNDEGVADEETIRCLQLSKYRMEAGRRLEAEYAKRDVRDWLQQDFSKDYSEDIGKMAEKATKMGSFGLANFLTGHLGGHRHSRGMALRLSLVNGTERDEEMEWLMGTNLRSFEHILEYSAQFSANNAYHFRKSATTGYFAFFLAVLYDYVKETKSDKIPWSVVDGKLKYVNQVFGCGRDLLLHKIKSKMDGEFNGCFRYDADGIVLMDAGVLNIPNEPKFADAKWRELL